MIKTQVKLPDYLYAEVMRRGLEYMAKGYPSLAGNDPWRPPEPRALGRFQGPVETWRDLANGVGESDSAE